MKITIGCDPEFFLYDTKLKMNVSAHDLVPGTKYKPYPLKHGAVQVDGTSVEFNIDPAETAEEFVHNIREVLAQIRQMIPNQYSFIFQPTVEYSKKYFDEVVPKNAKELGCDPDYGSRLGFEEMNPRPQRVGTMSTGAGHIHVGWTKDKDTTNDQSHKFDCWELAKILSQVHRLVKPKYDPDGKRMQMYGVNGPFRYKSYGMEFREPSNAWLRHPELWSWMFHFHKNVLTTMLEFESASKDRYLRDALYYAMYNGGYSATFNTKLTKLFNLPEFPKNLTELKM